MANDVRELREQEEKERQARRERRKQAQEAVKTDLENQKAAQQAQAEAKEHHGKPTPTPVEIDLARLGLALDTHEDDGSSVDTRAMQAAPAEGHQSYSTRALGRRGRQESEQPKTE